MFGGADARPGGSTRLTRQEARRRLTTSKSAGGYHPARWRDFGRRSSRVARGISAAAGSSVGAAIRATPRRRSTRSTVVGSPVPTAATRSRPSTPPSWIRETSDGLEGRIVITEPVLVGGGIRGRIEIAATRDIQARAANLRLVGIRLTERRHSRQHRNSEGRVTRAEPGSRSTARPSRSCRSRSRGSRPSWSAGNASRPISTSPDRGSGLRRRTSGRRSSRGRSRPAGTSAWVATSESRRSWRSIRTRISSARGPCDCRTARCSTCGRQAMARSGSAQFRRWRPARSWRSPLPGLGRAAGGVAGLSCRPTSRLRTVSTTLSSPASPSTRPRGDEPQCGRVDGDAGEDNVVDTVRSRDVGLQFNPATPHLPTPGQATVIASSEPAATGGIGCPGSSHCLPATRRTSRRSAAWPPSGGNPRSDRSPRARDSLVATMLMLAGLDPHAKSADPRCADGGPSRGPGMWKSASTRCPATSSVGSRGSVNGSSQMVVPSTATQCSVRPYPCWRCSGSAVAPSVECRRGEDSPLGPGCHALRRSRGPGCRHRRARAR